MTTILVVEDEQPLLEEIAGTLAFEGFDIITADNGLDGIRQAQTGAPDLVVCDIAMPEMDGYNVLLELRKNPATAPIPFMFLTARADKSFMRHGMELGADDYLTKPFTNSELLAAVRARLQRQTALAETRNLELEQAKSSLARMVVHELRTPLVSVQLAKDIIERQLSRLTPSGTKELLDTMGPGINRLNHVVEQMVYLTQIETGLLNRKEILQTGTLAPITPILSSSVTLARRFAVLNQDGEIKVTQHDESGVIAAHVQSLKHALAEIIANALNFTAASSSVDIHQWQAEGHARISVLDHGQGITLEDQKKLFQRHVQLRRSTEEQQGMGLGLFVSQQIIAAHGGSIIVQSVPDWGTLIEISIPLVNS